MTALSLRAPELEECYMTRMKVWESTSTGSGSLPLLFGPIRILVFILLVLGLADDVWSDETELPTKRVLILYTHRVAMPITQHWDKGIRASLQAELKQPVTIDVEYVDSDRLGGQEAIKRWFELLLLKYTATPPDLIIPVFDPTAIAFANHAQALFPSANVVFCSITERTKSLLQINNKTTGVIYRIDHRKTVELGKQLFPKMKKLIVICGSSRENLAILEDFKLEMQGAEVGEVEYWIGLPIQEMSSMAERASEDSLILYLVHDRDKDGRSFATPQEVVAQLAEASAVPIFGLYDTLMGSGVIGGVMAPVEGQGRKAGSLAAQILNGRPPADLSFTNTGDNSVLLDWRQLQRWKIAENRLPHQATLLFRQPTIWEKYWYYLLGVSFAIALQSVLITGLWINRKQRIRAEDALANQLNFETFLSEVRSRFIHVPLDQLTREVESTLKDIAQHLGFKLGAVYELTGSVLALRFSTGTNPQTDFRPVRTLDVSAIGDVWLRLRGGEVGYVNSRPTPTQSPSEAWLTSPHPCYGWILPLTAQGAHLGVALFVSTKVLRTDDPTVPRLIVLADLLANVLARERAEKELQLSRGNAQQLARKLLTAQEDERRHLAREMHDDITQRLAAAAIAAGQLRSDGKLSQESQIEANALSESLIEISKDVHQFSRRLHPSILEELGLLDAIRHECNAVHSQSNIVVAMRYSNIPESIPKDIQLCLYRIVQETLRNMIKHSKATEGEILLSADAENVRLQVKDNGCGIDARRGEKQPGLGLIAIQERVQLVGGNLAITSVENSGTHIDVCVPFLQAESS